MNTYSLIVNPAAGQGFGSKAAARLRQLLDSRGAEYELRLTERQGHATELARQATGSVVIAVGGDGTVNEVVNGLLGSEKALGIIPAGSGNDFIKSVGIPDQIEVALDKCLYGKRLVVDVGGVVCGSNGNVRMFLNGVGIGFDAAVAVRTKQIQFLRGTALYMLAVFQTLRKYRNPVMRIQIDGVSTEGRHLLIAIGNGVCAGGGFFLTPRAIVDDGLLDFCLIGDVSTGRILRLMPLVLWGKHVSRTDVVTYKTGRHLHVSTDEPIYVHADGEIVGEAVKEVDILVESRKLAMMV